MYTTYKSLHNWTHLFQWLSQGLLHIYGDNYKSLDCHVQNNEIVWCNLDDYGESYGPWLQFRINTLDERVHVIYRDNSYCHPAGCTWKPGDTPNIFVHMIFHVSTVKGTPMTHVVSKSKPYDKFLNIKFREDGGYDYLLTD